MNQDAAEFITKVVQQSGNGIRTGQALYNNLPRDAARTINSTVLDTFHRCLSHWDLTTWVDNHLIFQDGVIIALFRNDTILWERSQELQPLQ